MILLISVYNYGFRDVIVLAISIENFMQATLLILT